MQLAAQDGGSCSTTGASLFGSEALLQAPTEPLAHTHVEDAPPEDATANVLPALVITKPRGLAPTHAPTYSWPKRELRVPTTLSVYHNRLRVHAWMARLFAFASSQRRCAAPVRWRPS